jgi:CheY-like chemotaxis protein
VRIVFSDNGPGIAPDHLRRIFDPFWTTKGVGEGTGLGMSISLNIVSKHGGRVWAESTLGNGARFFVEFQGTAVELNTFAEAQVAEPFQQEENASSSILVIDDEEPVIMLIAEVLGLDGHEITPAFNGGEALDFLQQRDFDLIISDVRMPAVGGPTFFEILQTTRPDLLPRVVFVTGDTVSTSTQDFLRPRRASSFNKTLQPGTLACSGCGTIEKECCVNEKLELIIDTSPQACEKPKIRHELTWRIFRRLSTRLGREFAGFVENFLVVWLFSDFRHQLGVSQLAVFVHNENGAGVNAQFFNVDAVSATKVSALEVGEQLHFFHAFSAAPAFLSERRVDADGVTHNRIRQRIEFTIKARCLD